MSNTPTPQNTAILAATVLMGLALGVTTAHAVEPTTSTQFKAPAANVKTTATVSAEGAHDATGTQGTVSAEGAHDLKAATSLKTSVQQKGSVKSEGANDLTATQGVVKAEGADNLHATTGTTATAAAGH